MDKNDTLVTYGQIKEVDRLATDQGEAEKYYKYMKLRLIPLSHEDAMLVLDESISVIDCQRLRKASGTMQEIYDLMWTYLNMCDAEGSKAIKLSDREMIDRYVVLRCEKSVKAADAFSRVCDAAGIDEEKYSEVKQRQRELESARQ